MPDFPDEYTEADWLGVRNVKVWADDFLDDGTIEPPLMAEKIVLEATYDDGLPDTG